ncbi:amidohydrolase family protein [Stenotrophobium rhamnosiphilum]|uniref:Hydrolase n=1 Tax=Stenotrophobium rhamnosiphilum TaxID=2029166 RepID=A0A2T5MGB5_9GAMM|nr:amidohydrolase family protein [Stenotrophobium rhamnosiphilum]PTU31603.1 hydrolase [Stenotrophobium rhamnosiphilum]
MLIRNAEINFDQGVDVRITGERISAIESSLLPLPEEEVIDANGGALLPGLNDHHVHLYAFAAAQASVSCGPPQVRDAEALRERLRAAAATLSDGAWLRGIAYHESVAGEIDRDWLDAAVPNHPVRVQHRSGRLWILNSSALKTIGAEYDLSAPLERVDGRATGRLYDSDAWLRTRTSATRPALHQVSRLFASYGITGLTDTSHQNGPAEFSAFAEARSRGELLQALRVMGDARLDAVTDVAGVTRGEHKFHLHDHELPEFDALCADIRRSHSASRAVAFHSVTRTDLVFALAALREVGSIKGDRIEHGAVVPPELLNDICELGLTVATQPHFISERGDAYLRDVAAEDQPWLYRLRAFIDAGVPLAAGSDVPYGDANPWASMQAAVSRRSESGVVMAQNESLTPEQALALFLSPLDAPGAAPRKIIVGAIADLCLLTTPWRDARIDLSTVRVQRTWAAGRSIWKM